MVITPLEQTAGQVIERAKTNASAFGELYDLYYLINTCNPLTKADYFGPPLYLGLHSFENRLASVNHRLKV